ncbi:MAG: hypothetical protein CL908_25225, partial [Deltaproteobacteria bacterium]|nr:hypothetical protein [Deltaproteobacteria bacterium]
MLTPESIGGIEIDVCDDGCAGIWFDNHELEKLRKAILDDGAASPGVTPAPNPAVNEGRRRCPRCDVVMMRHRHPDGR